MAICIGSFFISAAYAQVSSLDEGFDVLPTTWKNINNSNPKGPNNWFHPTTSYQTFDAYSGDTTSFLAANYGATTTTGAGDISLWFISPLLNLENGGVVKFWTRTVSPSNYPDRLELRLSTAGASINVGTTSTSTGDFTTLLLSINPNLKKHQYPEEEWTQFTATISGLTAPTTGKIAFRYWVTNGGFLGANSNYIGVDDFSYNAEPLAVNFLSFDGSVKDSKVVLNWATSGELNNKGFDVERSADGRSFTAINFVKGNGTTANLSKYTFTDGSKFLSGTTYYRLKQIDVNGAIDYSKIIQVNIQNTFKWAVYPNPVLKDSWLQLQLAESSKVTIQLVSSEGRILQSIDKGLLQPGTYSVPLNLNTAAKGTYFAKLVVNGKTYSQTLIK